ncbi:MAG: hypothetical protein GX872_00630 [Firmicutes bacterium]|nr:hypothetical protein [Bacillota bacterium]HXL03720.1 hypothetical protein [Bacillota bacterium]
MDAIFALIFIVYILSAVFQAVLKKDTRKRQRRAGAPWPETHPPGKIPDEGTPIPPGFPFPFPFEDVSKGGHEEEQFRDDLEYEDMTAQPADYDDKEKVVPWEDKSWGSLGPSLEGQSFEELEHDALYESHVDDDFHDDFDDIALMDDDVAEFMAFTESKAYKGMEFTSRSAVIQGIIMSEILKRPRAFSYYPIIRQ